MPTDAPSNLPPVLRPDAPPVHSLDDLAARFGVEVRGDTAGVTLDRAHPRDRRPAPGRRVRRRPRREPPRRRVRRDRRGEGRRRRRDGCRRSRARRGERAAGRHRRRPPRPSRRAVGVGLQHRPRRSPAAAVRTDRHQRQDERVAHARGHPRPARRRHRTVVHGGAPHRRPGDRLAADDARGVRDARAPRPDARARRRGRRRRGQRAGAQPPPRRRHRVRRRRIHQPDPRPPR